MRYLIPIVLLCNCLVAYPYGDTLHVITHQKTTIVTDPTTGFKPYKRWGVFPSPSMAVRKVVLHVKFACPDSMRCADWDYLDFISIKRVGGRNGKIMDYEIARMLTPYGGAFTKDWKFNWEIDVTDFSLLLRDSVEIEYYHSGYEANHDRGWKVTLDFEIIKGKPFADPVSITKIYNGNYKYGDKDASIEEQLPPVKFKRAGNADFGVLKISQTGHGANEPDGCGEFCSKKREVVINGKSVETRSLWRECGDNPLYPQAGTWIFDRANWCPGYLQTPDDYHFPLAEENTVDVNMEPYTIDPNQAVENMVAYIVQYKKNNAKHDVSLVDVVVPSKKYIHSRKNPTGHLAQIVVKNSGTTPIRSFEINYGTKGFPQKKFQWKGTLPWAKIDTITLPGMIDGTSKENFFSVSITRPNGNADEFPQDNALQSVFSMPPVHGKEIIVTVKTNNQPAQNYYQLFNLKGEEVRKRPYDSLQKNKLFRDTLKLEPGSYQFKFLDTGGDGLEFWFNNKGGSGFMRIEDTKGNLLKQFDSDFGNFIHYSFIVSEETSRHSAVNEVPFAMVYPTRTTGSTTLNYFSGIAGDVKVQIVTDEGNNVVEEHLYKNLKEGAFVYDLSYRPAQRYYLRVWCNGEMKYNKRIRVVQPGK